MLCGPEEIAEAVRRLRKGGLVAFPTETVYGLGALALNADAVARVFAAKGPAVGVVVASKQAGFARSLRDQSCQIRRLVF